MEAMYRIFSFKMYDMSHTIHRLAIHLENCQRVIFDKDEAEQAIEDQRDKRTTLQTWLELNEREDSARNLLYTEIPFHYVLANNKYKERERGADKVITRIYSVSPRDTELYSLRLLLLHIPGMITV
jgi:hypothetical protein